MLGAILNLQLRRFRRVELPKPYVIDSGLANYMKSLFWCLMPVERHDQKIATRKFVSLCCIIACHTVRCLAVYKQGRIDLSANQAINSLVAIATGNCSKFSSIPKSYLAFRGLTFFQVPCLFTGVKRHITTHRSRPCFCA